MIGCDTCYYVGKCDQEEPCDDYIPCGDLAEDEVINNENISKEIAFYDEWIKYINEWSD